MKNHQMHTPLLVILVILSPIFLLFLLFLYVFFVLAIMFFPFYQLVLRTIGFLVVSTLIILILRSRYRLRRYGLGIMAAGIILYVSFVTIPEFNFLMTFTARQQIVNQFVQENIKVENSWLGETNYFKNSSGVSVYFTYFKNPGRFGSRVFFVYKTDNYRATGVFSQRMTVKVLRKNWYFVEDMYAS